MSLNSVRMRRVTGGGTPGGRTAHTASSVLPSSFCSLFFEPTFEAITTMLLLPILRFRDATRDLFSISWLLNEHVCPISSPRGGPYWISVFRLSLISVKDMA